jgi:hypothetical protein
MTLLTLHINSPLLVHIFHFSIFENFLKSFFFFFWCHYFWFCESTSCFFYRNRNSQFCSSSSAIPHIRNSDGKGSKSYSFWDFLRKEFWIGGLSIPRFTKLSNLLRCV